MAALLTHRNGASEPYTGDQALTDLLAELDRDDPEHPDVAVSHESGWTLSAFPSGLLVWENVEGDALPRHMVGVRRTEAHHLFSFVAQGHLEAVEVLTWAEGYGGWPLAPAAGGVAAG